MRYIHFKLVGPAIVGIVILIAALATVPYFGARQIDLETRERQEKLVESNIALWISDIEFSLTSWTIWDESIEKLDNSFDFEWADRNIGASLIGTTRTRIATVIDGDDKILYTRTDPSVSGRAFPADEPERVLHEAAPLIAAVRDRERMPGRSAVPADGGASQARPDESTFGIPQAVSSSRIDILGNEAFLLTASLFQPDFGTFRPRGPRAPILVAAMPIEGSLDQFFGQRFLLDDPRTSPLSDVAPDRARVAIAGGLNGAVEVLSWRAPTPAMDALRQSLPLFAVVALVLLAGCLFTFRVSRATAHMLVTRERQMWHAASHDVLTGLANRSRLDEEFRSMVARGPLAVVCVDLDGFKPVNDTHGHATGDELLKVVADRLRDGTGKADRLFRLGGDEFAIFVPDRSQADVEDLCRSLLQDLSAPIDLSGCTLTIGASFGICVVSDPRASSDAAFKAADAALYSAKSLGRGCVVSSPEIRPAPAVVGAEPSRSGRPPAKYRPPASGKPFPTQH